MSRRTTLAAALTFGDHAGRTWDTLEEAQAETTGDEVMVLTLPADTASRYDVAPGPTVAWRVEGRWVTDWGQIASLIVARTRHQGTEDAAWVRLLRPTTPLHEALWAVEQVRGDLRLPEWSTLAQGRVRRAQDGRWVAEVGSGSTLRTLGVRDTPDEAETAVRDALGEARRRVVDSLGDDPLLAELGERLRREPMRVDVWATTEERYYSPAGQGMVGLAEIAVWLGVARQTADNWRQRGVLPEPDASVGGRPAWRRATIEEWARGTGRLQIP